MPHVSCLVSSHTHTYTGRENGFDYNSRCVCVLYPVVRLTFVVLHSKRHTHGHTFDNQAIATECGIFDPGYGVALEGPAFRKMTPAQLDDILPRLQVTIP